MPRHPRPWLRKGRGWYVKLEGRQVALGRDRAEAHRAFHALMSGRRRPVASALTVADVFNLFAADVAGACARGELSHHTRDSYHQHLRLAGRAFGRVLSAEVRPHHVLAWAGSGGGSAATRKGRIAAVKRAFRWARKVGHIEADPLAETPAPDPGRREAVLSPGQFHRLREAVAGETAFHDLVTALHHSGCRPGEVYRLTAAMCDLEAGFWRVPNKTARQTGRKVRPVPLTPELVALSRRLGLAYPEGPIFRNSEGNPWTISSVSKRFRKLRKTLGMGKELTPVSLRHLFATDMAVRGVPLLVAAAVMGHVNSKMLARIYAHVGSREDDLKAAVRKVRGG